MKYRVNWKLEGTYTVTSEGLDLPDDADIDEVKELIEEEPLLGVSPEADGKLTLEVIPD